MRKVWLSYAVAAVSVSLFIAGGTQQVGAHGDVVPQAVDTAGLPDLGEEWLEENPWRDPKGEYWKRAIEVGASGYNQNCARCHGLEAISGGLAPDLRFLEAELDGDEWYLERYIQGYTQNGITKMPAFGELLGQKAAWAIRTYIETRPDEGAMDDHLDRLKEIRETLKTIGSGEGSEEGIQAMRMEMEEIAKTIETGSGAPVADSAASRAAAALDGTPQGVLNAVEVLTVGLSAAQ